MIKVSIIGFGNVAQHLFSAFVKTTNIEVVQIFSRTLPEGLSGQELSLFTNDYQSLQPTDLFIVAVKDDAISEVTKQFLFKNQLVVHTSGAASMDVISSGNRSGVFYPLQTFTKNKEVNFQHIPICLEAQNQADYNILEEVAKSISNQVFAINSQQRKSLHVAAVFVNNFTNHLYAIGSEICKVNNVPFQILAPLIEETALKIQTIEPLNAQTGPAIRRDQKTMESHLEFLNDENYKEIYKILTHSIQDHVKKL